MNTMENRYRKSDRIWVMDRSMVSEDNLTFLREENRRYIVGTPKSMLKKFEAEVLKSDWNTIRDGLEVKLCQRPRDESDEDAEGSDTDDEIFILCRSRDRSKKEEAMVDVPKRKSKNVSER